MTNEQFSKERAVALNVAAVVARERRRS